MLIYISGKISGLEEGEYNHRFAVAEVLLWEVGHTPVNPVKLKHDHDKSWESYMLKDIEALFKCQGIYMLSNWKLSAGARIEHAIAVERGMKILYQ